MKTKYRFIYFEEGRSLTKKMAIWYCYNTKSEDTLGVVEWYQPWRRWVFFVDNDDVVFSSDCLEDIVDFMKQLPKEPLTPE